MYEESEIVELKEKLIDEIKNEIVAFLNTNGGTIYVGVKDDGTIAPIVDQKERDIIDVKVANWIQEAIYPIPSGFIKYCFNKENVLVIEIKRGEERPYYLRDKGPKPSGVYKRVGTSTRKANESEIMLMMLDSKHYSYEEDVAEEQELSFKYFFDVCNENDIAHDKRNLRSLRILNKNDEYTNLGLLMSDQSPVVIKFAKYDKHLNFIVKKEFKGSLIKVLNNVLEGANNYNDVSAVIDGTSWKRIETISYPGASLREAILNAVAHANYFIRSNIKIEFYEDKVKITNPGGIYQATLKQILSGIQTYRNPGLVNILSKLDYIENFGTGIPRILEAYKDCVKKPEFDPSENFFVLTLPNANAVLHNDPVNDPVNDNLNDMELAIMKIISKEQGLNSKAIYERLKADNIETTLDVIKNALKRKLTNYCEFRGSFKSGGYYLK